MRTKILLTVAAALAVSAVSSMAQVYSDNVVGYINTTIGSGGYYMLGNQLVNGSDTAKTNNDVNAVLGAGLKSQPNDPPSSYDNTVLYYYNGGYATYYYFNAADATAWEGFASPAGFYDAAGTPASITLTQGKAVFLYNPSGSAITATITGNVLQGTNSSQTIQPGYNMISLQVPISTNVVGTTYGLPTGLTSDPVDPPNPSKNDVMYLYSGGYATYYYFNAVDATAWEGFASPAGFYDAAGTPAPAPSVNQGFFLYHTGASVPWTSAFTVQ